MKIIAYILCAFAGGLAGYFGGWGAVVSVILAEIGISLLFINQKGKKNVNE